MHCGHVRVSLGRIPEICPRFLKKPSKTSISEAWLQFLGPRFGPLFGPFFNHFCKKVPQHILRKSPGNDDIGQFWIDLPKQ